MSAKAYSFSGIRETQRIKLQKTFGNAPILVPLRRFPRRDSNVFSVGEDIAAQSPQVDSYLGKCGSNSRGTDLARRVARALFAVFSNSKTPLQDKARMSEAKIALAATYGAEKAFYSEHASYIRTLTPSFFHESSSAGLDEPLELFPR